MKMQLCLAIIYKLMRGERVRAKSLALEFEVSTRTIYRYLDAIIMAGFNIVSRTGKNGGYELAPQDAIFALSLAANKVSLAAKSSKKVI